MLMQLTEQDCS